MLALCEVPHGGPEYEATVELRNLVLRAPLGLTLDPRELSLETDSFHLAAFEDEGPPLGCLLLTPLGEYAIKLRQMAVRPEWKGRGVGRALVERAERFSRERGFRTIKLHARAAAVEFYERLGYLGRGQSFLELDIPHLAMEKALW